MSGRIAILVLALALVLGLPAGALAANGTSSDDAAITRTDDEESVLVASDDDDDDDDTDSRSGATSGVDSNDHTGSGYTAVSQDG